MVQARIEATRVSSLARTAPTRYLLLLERLVRSPLADRRTTYWPSVCLSVWSTYRQQTDGWLSWESFWLAHRPSCLSTNQLNDPLSLTDYELTNWITDWQTDWLSDRPTHQPSPTYPLHWPSIGLTTRQTDKRWIGPPDFTDAHQLTHWPSF